MSSKSGYDTSPSGTAIHRFAAKATITVRTLSPVDFDAVIAATA